MLEKYHSLPWNQVTMLSPLLRKRMYRNRQYMLHLKTENLLQHYYQEAGIWNPPYELSDSHGGWEGSLSQLRGHFLGHWLSAAARLVATTGDPEIKGKAEAIVGELARCQRENGGEWAGSIPHKYLDWAARGKEVWAPHYVVHKTLMGLFEMYELTGNEQALQILVRWADWFHRWTGQFSRTEMDTLLDVETGGMLEVWANLYGVTGQPQHLELIQRYDRPRFFHALFSQEDALTNRHANTTIPEIHGAARAWEVTGEQRWRDIVEAYWQQAVTRRGFFCTGGQTNDERWTPPFQFAPHLTAHSQEFCTVYNMMRLANYLFRWTGEVQYADYYERNLYNGILAQQHPDTGMVAYFLPLEAGGRKLWGSRTEHFWCCQGTLIQALANQSRDIYFASEEGLAVCQYLPSRLNWQYNGTAVKILQDVTQPDTQDRLWASQHHQEYRLEVECSNPVAFSLQLRLPWWLASEPIIELNGQRLTVPNEPSSFYTIRRTWQHDHLLIRWPKQVQCVPLPDAPEQVAFMDGPVVLAGLTADAPSLVGNPKQPEAFLQPHFERPWTSTWEDQWLHGGYQTIHQERSIYFQPLCDICDEPYTVYFPLKSQGTEK
jgi:uncharacterized protein